MNAIRFLSALLILAGSGATHAASVYVQHQGDVTQNPVLALDSGPGFSLSADLVAGFFQIFADASATVSVNNNFSGTFNPVEFVNNTGATVFLSAGAIHASVHANFFDGPASGGTDFATTMRTKWRVGIDRNRGWHRRREHPFRHAALADRSRGAPAIELLDRRRRLRQLQRKRLQHARLRTTGGCDVDERRRAAPRLGDGARARRTGPRDGRRGMARIRDPRAATGWLDR